VGDTTRRHLERGFDQKASLSPAAELQLRISCAGRTSTQVLDDISSGLTEALARQQDPLLVLEDLGRLQDSVMALIKGLSRLVYKYPRPVACWESSGLAEAFLSVMDHADQPVPTEPESPSDC
jgi:hypothetical protein